jgi:hypothetical protein
MLNKIEMDVSASRRKTQSNEVRLLVVILFPCFFVAAASRRVVSLASGKRRGISCFEEAKRSTYSVIPYAVMQ